MTSVNLPSYIDDPNYRYTMPKVRCKIEGSGNGIKTNCINAREIASALKRNPEYLTKWFGCELCVQAKYFSDEGKAILQGVHSEEELTKAVDRFCEKYVLCPKCQLPEIDMMITGKKSIGCKCNACGHVDNLDSTHRVAATIFKNPPSGATTVMQSKDKDKKEKKKKQEDVPEKKRVKTKKHKDQNDELQPEKKKIKVKKVKAFKVASTAADRTIIKLGIATRNISDDKTVDAEKFSQELRTMQIAEGFNSKEKVHVGKCYRTLFVSILILGLSALLIPTSVLNIHAQCDDDAQVEKKVDGDVEKPNKEKFIVDKIALSMEFVEHCLPYMEEITSSSTVSKDDVLEGLQTTVHRFCTPETVKSVFPHLIKKMYDRQVFDDTDITSYFEAESNPDAYGYNQIREAITPLLEWLNQPSEDESGSEYEDSASE